VGSALKITEKDFWRTGVQLLKLFTARQILQWWYSQYFFYVFMCCFQSCVGSIKCQSSSQIRPRYLSSRHFPVYLSQPILVNLFMYCSFSDPTGNFDCIYNVPWDDDQRITKLKVCWRYRFGITRFILISRYFGG